MPGNEQFLFFFLFCYHPLPHPEILYIFYIKSYLAKAVAANISSFYNQVLRKAVK